MGIPSFLKTSLNAVSLCIVAPLGLSELLARSVLQRDVWLQSHGQLLSLLPGKVGSYVRNAYYWMTLEQCPLDCRFEFGSLFTKSGAVVGHRVYVGAHSRIGLVTIGDDTMLGDHVHLLSGRHQHSLDPGRPSQDQPQTFTRIRIGHHCWIGTNTVTMADIGNNCVIGAASVVTRPIPDNVVAVGNPARILRLRPNIDHFDAAFLEEPQDIVDVS